MGGVAHGPDEPLDLPGRPPGPEEPAGQARPALAVRLGYRNVTKGVRRIDHLEREGCAPDGFAEAVARVLGVEPGAVAGLAAQDRGEAVRAWNEWAGQPVPVEVVVRAVPGLFVRHPLPLGLDDPDEVVAYARGPRPELAEGRGRRPVPPPVRHRR